MANLSINQFSFGFIDGNGNVCLQTAHVLLSSFDTVFSLFFFGSGASGGAQFEAIYDSIKMKKSSFYFNQFKDVQTRKLRSENLKLEKELGEYILQESRICTLMLGLQVDEVKVFIPPSYVHYSHSACL